METLSACRRRGFVLTVLGSVVALTSICTSVSASTESAVNGLSAFAEPSSVTVSLPATEDARVASGSTSTNYGTAVQLTSVGGSRPDQSFLRFVLPAAPAGATLTGATLSVRTSGDGTAGSTEPHLVHVVPGDWSESSLTWSSRPIEVESIFGTLPSAPSINTSYRIAGTPSVLAARLGHDVTLRVSTSGQDSLRLWSREAATSYRPTLNLTFTVSEPVPDNSPPSVPGGVSAEVSSDDVMVTWSASSDDTAVTGYTVHRAPTEDFVAGDSTKVAQVASTSFLDPTRPAGTWYYRVSAVDAAGNTSNASGPAVAAVVAEPSEPPDVLVKVARPTADARVASSSPSSNFGADTQLVVVGGSSPGQVFLRFALPQLPDGGTLTGAVFAFRTTTDSSAGSAAPHDVALPSEAWNETTLSWGNRPTRVSAALGSITDASEANTAYQFTLPLAAVQPRLGSTLDLRLSSLGSDALRIWSREAPASRRPSVRLTFEASPPVLASVDPAATSTIVAAGDLVCPPGTVIAANTCKHAEVRALLDGLAPDRFVALGDLAQGLGSYEEFTAPGRYGDTFGDLTSITLPVVGNHEGYDPDASGYWDFFYGRDVSAGSFGDRPDGFYTAVIGSWRFIGLNSECQANGTSGGCGPGSPQYTWLRALLRHDTAPCTVAAWHQSRWTTSNSHEPNVSMAPLWDLLADGGVDVALTGHNHVAEVFKTIGASGTNSQPVLSAAGIRSFTVGIGGADLVGFKPVGAGPFAALEARAKGTFGLLELDLAPGEYDWAFRPIAGSTFTASGTGGGFTGHGTCH